MKRYISTCHSLPFYGFNNLQCNGNASRKGSGAEEKPTASAAGSSNKKQKEKKVKYEKVPIKIGLTCDCSVIKFNEKNEIERGWRISQIFRYSLRPTDNKRDPAKQKYITPAHFILTFQFGEQVPPMLQVINRKDKGILGSLGKN